jgi:hypothetical protein
LTSYKDIDFDEVQEHLKFLADSIWHDITVSDFKLKVLYIETLKNKPIGVYNTQDRVFTVLATPSAQAITESLNKRARPPLSSPKTQVIDEVYSFSNLESLKIGLAPHMSQNKWSWGTKHEKRSPLIRHGEEIAYYTRGCFHVIETEWSAPLRDCSRNGRT